MQNSDDIKMINKKTIEKMHEYREILLLNDFLEPTIRKSSSWHWLFYKQVTRLTAFIVNLKGGDEGVDIVYGYASTAFTLMKGDEDYLTEMGILDEYINVREKILIPHDFEDKDARTHVKEMYEKYSHVEKDELLEIAKKKRKEFINEFATRLKPLGFKKKANTWKRSLKDEFYLMFNAQKSSFSDEYYFNVYIGKEGTNFYGDCHYSRIYPKEFCPLDWQTFSHNEMVEFIENDVIKLLQYLIDTPLCELGKDESIWKYCDCDRKQCAICWVQKNRQEANEIS